MGNALKIAMRDAEERGPGHRFFVELSRGKKMKGAITRYSLSFDFDEGISSEEKQEVENLIGSFEISINHID